MEKVKEKISEYIDKNKDWLIDRLIDIVSVDTINSPPYGNEKSGQDILERIL